MQLALLKGIVNKLLSESSDFLQDKHRYTEKDADRERPTEAGRERAYSNMCMHIKRRGRL